MYLISPYAIPKPNFLLFSPAIFLTSRKNISPLGSPNLFARRQAFARHQAAHSMDKKKGKWKGKWKRRWCAGKQGKEARDTLSGGEKVEGAKKIWGYPIAYGENYDALRKIALPYIGFAPENLYLYTVLTPGRILLYLLKFNFSIMISKKTAARQLAKNGSLSMKSPVKKPLNSFQIIVLASPEWSWPVPCSWCFLYLRAVTTSPRSWMPFLPPLPLSALPA